MGAFSDLMVEARKLGADSLGFAVELDGYVGECDRDRWACWTDMRDGKHVTGEGRSGEEALRVVVNALKRGGT